MFPVDVFRETVGKLVTLLKEHEVRFHVTGGLTSIAYGDPRMTQDVDFVVDGAALSERLEPFLESLAASDFLHDQATIRAAVAEGDMFQLIDRDEMLKLDVYPREMIPGELKRAELHEVFKEQVLPVASRQDTIVAKLIWIDKGSHKGRRDLRHLYRNTNEAQRAFVAEMAERFGLTALLAEVLAEPDEIR